MPEQQTTQQVSTEPQRIALERMSAELVHKLNVMIAEQEERARRFAEQHHSTVPVPQNHTPTVTGFTPPTVPAPTQAQTPARQRPLPPPPATRREEPRLRHHEYDTRGESTPSPLRIGPKKKTEKPQEEGNIGMGMIIFSIIGIIMLLRACT